MNQDELKQIKNTYNKAGFFLLYVDEVGFEPTLVATLMNDNIYTINDFESKFIKNQYPETETQINELKFYLECLIQDMSNNILSAKGRGLEDLLESFSALVETDKVAIRNLSLERYSKPELLKVLFKRHYEVKGLNISEFEAISKYVDEKHAEYLKSIETI